MGEARLRWNTGSSGGGAAWIRGMTLLSLGWLHQLPGTQLLMWLNQLPAGLYIHVAKRSQIICGQISCQQISCHQVCQPTFIVGGATSTPTTCKT